MLTNDVLGNKNVGILFVGFLMFFPLISIMIDMPCALAAGDSNEALKLDATVEYYEGNFSLTNVNDFDWTKCTFRVSTRQGGDEYLFKKEKVEAHQQYIIPASKFAGGDNDVFNPFDTPPETLSIHCHTLTGTDSLKKNLSVEKDID